MDYLISLLIITCLVGCSALFSGLTLGYFTLEPQSLRRRAKAGDRAAAIVLPVRERGNHLLTTLLLGNVAVNSVLAIFLGTLANGVLASVIATAVIFLCGEIIPQSVLSRHALYFGSKAAPLVRTLMWLSAPLTWPIAATLDRVLGQELPSMYSHSELMELVAEHEASEHSPIDADERRIVHGALMFSHTAVREVMTPAEQVIMYDAGQRLDGSLRADMDEHGYSRYPLYQGSREHLVGLLYTKDLITETDSSTLRDTEAFEADVLTVRPSEKLDTVLTKMLKRRRHLAFVQNKNAQFIGVISLEDIIEEIIQEEIEDEDDEERED
ncbi:MAG TPA: CNNM domain-containing protein [Candidatus Paceibacterota bacterium]|nr:CNNM domain-containing protein [Candidatus Paceibacterota bacterium]